MIEEKTNCDKNDSESEDEEEIVSKGIKRKCIVESDEGNDSSDYGDEEDETDDEASDESGEEDSNDDDESYLEDESDFESETGESIEEEDEKTSNSKDVKKDHVKSSSKQMGLPSSSGNPPNALHQDVDSDSSTQSQDGDVCAICLGKMRGNIGSPEQCDHAFCLDCILEWAKSNNSCPQDRTPFLQVFVRKRAKGRIIKTIQIEKVKPEEDIPPEEDDEEPTFCEVCGRCDREDTLLLCDGCDLGYHLDCLSPPLSQVPVEEWFCSDCHQTQSERGPVSKDVDLSEVAELLDEADNLFTHQQARNSRNTNARSTGPRRRVPRTRASERVIGRITRARRGAGNRLSERLFAHLDLPSDSEDEEDEVSSDYEDSELESETEVTNVPKPAKTAKPAKRRKRTRKTRTKTKKTTTKTKSTIRKTTKTTTKKVTTKTRKRKTNRKTTKKKPKAKRGTKRKMKRRGKKRSKRRKVAAPIITPKARLAEVMGIRCPKNPWQLSLPAMKGGTVADQKDPNDSVVSQKYKMGLPSLCLLGNYSEMDYESVPDEVADAILVAGVRRRLPTTAESIARRKAVAASAMMSSSVSSRSIPPPPISDAHVSSVSDILGDLMESQSRLHGVGGNINRKDTSSTPKGGRSNPLKGFKPLIRRHGFGGTESPKGEAGGKGGVNNSNDAGSGTQNGSNTNGDYGHSGGNDGGNNSEGYGLKDNSGTENFTREELPLGCLPFGVVSEDPDPTGSKAYSSFLNQNSNSNDSYVPEGLQEFENEKEEKEKKNTVTKVAGVEDIDLYSDIEPDAEDELDAVSEENSEKEDENKDPDLIPVAEDDPISSGDELVIDDKAQSGNQKNAFPDNPYDERILHEQRQLSFESEVPCSLVDIPSPENEVGSTTLPGLKDFELEAVSDEDTQEMEKSMTSSISLSDSNMGDAEVTSSTTEQILADHELKPPTLFGEVQRHLEKSSCKSSGMGLRALETETISDNEEICFDDAVENAPIEETIEEGEIPNETPSELPSIRPKINIQLRRTIEFPAVFSKEFDGEYEEGEIVDENREQKKREKARKEVDEVVNASLDDGEESKKEEMVEEKENVDPEPNIAVNEVIVGPILSEPDLSSPEKIPEGLEVDAREKIKEKREKNKDGDKEKHKGEKNKDKDISFKKVSKSSKVRNYRENEKEPRTGRRSSRDRAGSRDKNKRGRNKDRSGDRYRDRSGGRRKDRDNDYRKDFGKDFPKRRSEIERYNVRQMINKKEEERKKKDEFGRDVALRSDRPSRSRSKSKKKRKRDQSDQRSKNLKKKDGKSRRRSYSSSSSSSSSSGSSSSSYTSSSSSSSRSPHRRRRAGSKSPIRKKTDSGKKKVPVKVKDKNKKIDKPDALLSIEKKKDDKKKDKTKTKEVNGVANSVNGKTDKKRTKKKGRGGPRSKEVYQAGGSIMVSVNFNRKEKEKKKKDREMRLNFEQRQKRRERGAPGSSPYRMWASTSPGGGKRTPLQDEPMWSPELQNRIGLKSPDMADLDVIMLSPPPQEPILISDSDDEGGGGITRLPPDLGVQLVHSPRSPHRSVAVHLGGPKTPPEPGVKFTLSTKQALKPINNPLMEEEEDDDDDDAVVEVIPSRGPNTPPGAPPESDDGLRQKSPTHPGSPSSPEPDVYDPFDPTKSPSPSRGSPQQEARVTSSDQKDSDKGADKMPQKVSPISKGASVRMPQVSPSVPAPPLPAEPPKSKERPPEPKQKLPEDEASSTAAGAHLALSVNMKSPTKAVKAAKPSSIASALPQKTVPTPIMGPPPTVPSQPHVALPPTTMLPPTLNPVQQLFAGLPANVANILAAAAVRGATNSLLRVNTNQAATHTVLPPDFSRPPPANLSQPPPMLISPTKEKKDKSNYNGHHHMNLVDMDLGSPSSPDSSGMSDMFEPPSPHSTAYNNNNADERPSPRKRPQTVSKSQPLKKSDRFDNLFGSSHHPAKPSSMQKIIAKSKSHKQRPGGMLGKKLDLDDDIPSSAVEMQLLKKVQRQERVVEEVKLCLKPYYNRKSVSKEDYKDIMKKCVVKVCHNKSGEINPNKIRALVEGYVKKVKYYRKKSGGGVILPPTVNDPPPPGFKMKA